MFAKSATIVSRSGDKPARLLPPWRVPATPACPGTDVWARQTVGRGE